MFILNSKCRFSIYTNDPKKLRDNMSIIFLQQILSDKLLLIVIVMAKKVILMFGSNLNR